jgi:hypothetical protein
MSKHTKSIISEMPKSVRIGCFDFEVRIMSEDESDGSNAVGINFILKNRIGVRVQGMTPQQIANTLIHEVIHAIHYNHGLSDESDEETYTTLTANGICQFWQDNPKAIAWWEKAIALKESK